MKKPYRISPHEVLLEGEGARLKEKRGLDGTLKRDRLKDRSPPGRGGGGRAKDLGLTAKQGEI